MTAHHHDWCHVAMLPPLLLPAQLQPTWLHRGVIIIQLYTGLVCLQGTYVDQELRAGSNTYSNLDKVMRRPHIYEWLKHAQLFCCICCEKRSWLQTKWHRQLSNSPLIAHQSLLNGFLNTSRAHSNYSQNIVVKTLIMFVSCADLNC